VFGVHNNEYPTTITFAIETYFDNLSHLSVPITWTITCGDHYVITEVAGNTDPQFRSHNVEESGYHLPTYTHPYVAGCPITIWEVSGASGSDVIMTDMQNSVTDIVIDSVLEKVVKPADNTLHNVVAYDFYSKITA
jgi:hypothetical protein